MAIQQLFITATRLTWLLETLIAHQGELDWWPAQSRFEIIIGAVLTQNTAWRNVERAIANLHSSNLLNPEAILNAPEQQLTQAIRPSGYFNVKAQRLRNLCAAYLRYGGYDGLAELDTEQLRRRLLAVNGVGRETADDILLYAFARPIFVIDAYTRRIFSRLGWIDGQEEYDALRGAVEQAIGQDAEMFNELHAQLVILGKETCRPQPFCSQCPLRSACAYPYLKTY